MERRFCLIGIAIWLYDMAYQSGKREGSRKGYGVGFDHGRRSRTQSGCMIIVVVAALIAIAGIAIALTA